MQQQQQRRGRRDRQSAANNNNNYSGSISNYHSNPDDMVEWVFKVLVIGDIATGKTSLIRRYVHGVFRENSKPTIGVDFALKSIQWDRRTLVRMHLWDIAGQERFGHMTHVYYRDAVGAIIVFDVTRPASFEGALKWKRDLDAKVHVLLEDGTSAPVPCLLFANKSDLLNTNNGNNEWNIPVAKKDMDEFCQKHGFLGWMETSAKVEGPAIDMGARKLVKKMISQDHTLELMPDVVEISKDKSSSSIGNGSNSNLKDPYARKRSMEDNTPYCFGSSCVN